LLLVLLPLVLLTSSTSVDWFTFDDCCCWAAAGGTCSPAASWLAVSCCACGALFRSLKDIRRFSPSSRFLLRLRDACLFCSFLEGSVARRSADSCGVGSAPLAANAAGGALSLISLACNSGGAMAARSQMFGGGALKGAAAAGSVSIAARGGGAFGGAAGGGALPSGTSGCGMNAGQPGRVLGYQVHPEFPGVKNRRPQRPHEDGWGDRPGTGGAGGRPPEIVKNKRLTLGMKSKPQPWAKIARVVQKSHRGDPRKGGSVCEACCQLTDLMQELVMMIERLSPGQARLPPDCEGQDHSPPRLCC
jgi:hypothetical protein